MDILVKHSGTNITGYVLSYEREHKICTGIGILTLEVVRTINRTFDPWDSIDIHENGDFKVRYYVSSVQDSVPEGKLIIECQDLSKKLVDFFIPESYVIDYPSYTRYWIELFLDMAGVTYEFQTSSSGNLLSNHTQLGLVPAYEQILTLLQLSGWYMYFDGNGKAIIGTLQTDLADTTNSVGKTDILSISKLSDDKMLRNRALVLGAFDIYSMTYSTADVTIHTRWNYDNNDIRTMVVINSNIPNKGSAYSIANTLLKEFARITEEKRIEVHGARDYNLGEVCRVDSTVWKGKGLITTFGVRMSKTELVTDIVLDERCPRLFGFFDFGDWVYVGTYGDGIWRKHLRFDHTWHNFSTGLTDLRIIDLHINNGVFGSVATSGQMFRASSEDGPWVPIVVSGLFNSDEDTVPSGTPVNWIPFSGLMGRATVVDKLSNIVKFGIDTWSGLSYGDYFTDYSGWLGVTAFSGIMTSGVSFSGGNRGWVVEYDPFTGQPLGGLGSGIWPISVSGEYNIRVVDLENDGYNDYVSVKLGGGGGVEQGAAGYSLGEYTTSRFFDTYDSDSRVLQPSVIPESGRFAIANPVVRTHGAIAAVDNGVTGERDVVTVDSSGTIHRRRWALNVFGNNNSTEITAAFGTTGTILRVYRVNASLYRVFYFTSATQTITVYYKEWNTDTNTVGAETQIHQFLTSTLSASSTIVSFDYISVGDFGYVMTYAKVREQTQGGLNVFPEHVYLLMTTVNLQAGTAATATYFHYETEESVAFPGRYDYIAETGGHFAALSVNATAKYIRYGLFQNGDNDIKVLAWFEYGTHSDRWREVVIEGDSTTAGTTEIRDEPHPSRWGTSDATAITGNGRQTTQLTKTEGLILLAGATGQLGFAFNGTTFTTFTGQPPYYLNPNNIYPMYTSNTRAYIVRDSSSDFWTCDALALGVSSQVQAPAGYFLLCPFSNPLSFNDVIYWTIRNSDTFDTYLTIASDLNTVTTANAFLANTMSSSSNRGNNVGGFFFHQPSNWGVASPIVRVDYIYFGPDELESSRFLVLKRDGMDYTIVQEEAYPIRIDISNVSPLLTVGSGDLGFHSFYIYESSVEEIFNPVASGVRQVSDYRYTLLEPTFSGISASGLGVEQMGLYVHGSGVFGENIRTYSGGWQPIFSVPSGWGTRIETSNYGLGGQYVFVTASGFVQTFYQMDPGQLTFTAYSGMPQSRATIIRLDDRV